MKKIHKIVISVVLIVVSSLFLYTTLAPCSIHKIGEKGRFIVKKNLLTKCSISSDISLLFTPVVNNFLFSLYDTDAAYYTNIMTVRINLSDTKSNQIVKSIEYPKVIIQSQVDPQYNAFYPYYSLFPYSTKDVVVFYSSTPKILIIQSKTLSFEQSKAVLDTMLKANSTTLNELTTKYGVTIQFNKGDDIVKFN